MRMNDNITLRKATDSDLDQLWEMVFNQTQWKKFDAPYWPLRGQAKAEFQQGFFQKFVVGEMGLLIEQSGEVVGTVSAYWEDEKTRWLEVGITVYHADRWGRGIGRAALIPWITYLFNAHKIERIGLTTWSGNPRMIACAEAIGLRIEGQLRKVRYHNGEYFDSVKMGVLRDEWFALHGSH